MSLLKSVSRLLANTALIPVAAIKDIASIGDENKTGSELVKRSKQWVSSASEMGEIVVDASKVGGKKVLEVGKEVGLGLGEAGKVIQNIADGNQKTEVRVSEEEKPMTKQEKQQLKDLMPSVKDK